MALGKDHHRDHLGEGGLTSAKGELVGLVGCR